MKPSPAPPVPTILVGAFDRHNLGDLLFPHIVAQLLGEQDLYFAGATERDLCSAGGYRTRALSQLAREMGGQPVNILHVGGELLTCDAWQAAVMVQSPAQAQPIIQGLERDPERRLAWVRQELGVVAQAPYLVSRELFPGAANVLFNAIGGVELNERDAPFLAEVSTKLKEADYVSVRDELTRTHLNHLGIETRLVPDPAVMVAELFGERIAQHAQCGEVAAMLGAFPQGYIAVQFSADFGDDVTLRQMAGQLDQVVEASGYGIVLFRAGAAPWHDDLSCYQRLMGFMRSTQVKGFESLAIWEICALIAHSAAFCGSSLHGRIVATAYGLPRVNLSHPHKESRTGKQAAYAATWELPGIVATVDLTGIAAGIHGALATKQELLLNHAQVLAAKFLEEFTTIRSLLARHAKGPGRVIPKWF